MVSKRVFDTAVDGMTRFMCLTPSHLALPDCHLSSGLLSVQSLAEPFLLVLDASALVAAAPCASGHRSTRSVVTLCRRSRKLQKNETEPRPRSTLPLLPHVPTAGTIFAKQKPRHYPALTRRAGCTLCF